MASTWQTSTRSRWRQWAGAFTSLMLPPQTVPRSFVYLVYKQLTTTFKSLLFHLHYSLLDFLFFRTESFRHCSVLLVWQWGRAVTFYTAVLNRNTFWFIFLVSSWLILFVVVHVSSYLESRKEVYADVGRWKWLCKFVVVSSTFKGALWDTI